MLINPIYDPSVNTAPSGYKSAIQAAIQYLDATFGGNITINVHFGWGEADNQSLGSGVLGTNLTNGNFYTYSQLRSGLVGSATSATDLASLGSLPVSDPTNGGRFWLTDAMATNLHVASVSNIESWVGLSSSVAYSFDPANRAITGKYDAIGTLEHELTEVMGREGFLGKYFDPRVTNDYGPLDLFRYSAPGVRDVTGTGYFSADGGQTLLTKFNNPRNGGDAGDWDPSVQSDSFGDGYLGQASPLTSTDLKLMDVLGYSLIGSQSQSVVGTTGNDTFTSTSANESFDGLAGNDTVIFHGLVKDYTISRSGSTITLVDSVAGRDGTDTTTNIEHLQFSDFSVNTTIAATAAQVSSTTLNSIVELYVAYFNRAPDATGLSYWIGRAQAGETLASMSSEFYAAGVQYSQYTGYGPTTTNSAFVSLVYTNVLDRVGSTAPSSSETAYWTNLLSLGAVTRDGLISTMLTAAHSFANDATWGWVSKLLDNKVALGEYMAISKGLDYLSTAQAFTQTEALLATVTTTGYSTAVANLGIDATLNI